MGTKNSLIKKKTGNKSVIPEAAIWRQPVAYHLTWDYNALLNILTSESFETRNLFITKSQPCRLDIWERMEKSLSSVRACSHP